MKLELTEIQVLEIIKEWYTNGEYEDILQDEDGNDLEEIIENLINIKLKNYD